jgi:cleavage and polyadenylation specificity factor subunit 1
MRPLLLIQIYIWQLKDNDLVGVAFIDTNIYIHQLLSIKSLILVADVYKSISLLRFQEEYRTLSLVSRVGLSLSYVTAIPVVTRYR